MLSEQCDDANALNTDGCVGPCLIAECGDEFVNEGVEMCDDGDMNDGNDCKNDCTMPYCGDGAIWADGDGEEECDDANMSNDDACTTMCTESFCGDGVLWQGMETCDDGNLDDDDACPTTCMPAVCGDGFLQTGVEECDDGNMVDDDFCTNSCMGNGGVVWSGMFILNQNSAQQCVTWNTFRTMTQQINNFSTVVIRGSNHPQGVTCNGVPANTICQALGDGLAVNNVMCNGRTWNVGNCGNGPEINAQLNGVCACTSPGYTVRPCIGNNNWGGVNTATCGGPTQTIEVICG
jgi:cysteine-rich repeat protein